MADVSIERWNYGRVHVEGSADGQGIELVFRSITPEDSGNYACEATLDGKVERAEFGLKVIGKRDSSKYVFRKVEFSSIH